MTQAIPSKQFADEFVDTQQKKHQDPDAYRGYKFPVQWVMERTGGFGRDWIMYFMAQAGVGKTTMLTTAITQLGRDKRRFLYISNEESMDTVAARIFSNVEPLDRTKFRDIKLEQTDWPNVYTAAKEISEYEGFWMEGAYTPKEITEAVKDTDPDVVAFDYLQLAHFPGKTMNEQMIKASKFFAALARGGIVKQSNGSPKKMLVMVAAQLNDDGKPLYSRDPDRDADLSFSLETIDNGSGGILPDRRRLSITKFRHGEAHQSTLVGFQGARSLITGVARPNQSPPLRYP